jgi:hypothetical protein
MKLIAYKSSHTGIGGEYESIENVWNLMIEDTDTYSTKIKERFKTIEITQRTYINNVNKEKMTWYQGYRTNCFDKGTTDKEKLFIIDEVAKFLYDFKSNPLITQWVE